MKRSRLSSTYVKRTVAAYQPEAWSLPARPGLTRQLPKAAPRWCHHKHVRRAHATAGSRRTRSDVPVAQSKWPRWLLAFWDSVDLRDYKCRVE
jgi:hypothetical protein